MIDQEANPPFQDRFLKKFSQKKWDDFEKVVTKLIRDAVNPNFCINEKANSVIVCQGDEESFVSIGGNNPDYSQAIGIVQGVCYYGLGMRSLGADNINGTPKNWLSTMCREFGKAEYRRRKENGLIDKKNVVNSPV